VPGQDSVAIQSDVELGGTDQRFNNLVGRELQRMSGQEPQVVLLMPLLVGTDGVQKMSKSLGNYIGINDAPGDIFGKVMSIPDEAMRDYFVLCTNVPLDEVDVLWPAIRWSPRSAWAAKSWRSITADAATKRRPRLKNNSRAVKCRGP
jgi:tyrosyl-tRNA synthetase